MVGLRVMGGCATVLGIVWVRVRSSGWVAFVLVAYKRD